MFQISVNDCEIVLEKYFNDSKSKLLKFEIVASSTSSMGLLGASKSLNIVVERHGKVEELYFFLKQMPEGNAYHCDYVTQTGCFFKEVEFYNKIVNEIEKYMHGKAIPTCYLAKEHSLLILEDLSLSGFKTRNVREYFDIEHCQVALESLATLQAASLAWEEYNNTRLDERFPNIMFEALYVRDENNPGCKHLRLSIKAMKMIIDRYFQKYPKKIVQEAVRIYESLPEMVQPSTNHRNVVSNADLWCNNIMFSYGIESARLIDFQLMRYNPPALDALMMIYLNTEKKFRDKYLDEIIKGYFKCLHNQLSKSNLDPMAIITWGQFQESISEVMPIVLTTTSLFLHYVLIPEDHLVNLTKTDMNFKQFMELERNDLISEVLNNNNYYKQRVTNAVQELLNYVTEKSGK